MNILGLLLFSNILIIALLFCAKTEHVIKKISLIGSFFLLFLGCLLYSNFKKNSIFCQYEILFIFSNKLNLIYHLGIDGLSLFFVLLTLLLLPLCILGSWATIRLNIKLYYVILYFITFLLIQVFCVQDVLLFYIYFESILIPMFLLIGIWGSRDRKIHAAYQFFLYTLGGSILMLIGILYLLLNKGSTHIEVLCLQNYSLLEGRFLWLAFFVSFAVKVPMIPVHIWLPEAHVEAPTAGSVILAGILLKMGTYGLIKFSLPIFPEATIFFQPLVYLLSLIGIIYASCTTIRQIDLKKIIAYSSVGHMNYVTLGIASLNLYGLEGSIFLMIGHGLVSSALFFCIGLLYERYHTRILLYYGGLIYTMPIFGVFFLFFTLSNISLPGTSNFIGEFLVLIGVFNETFFVALVATVGIILGAVYSMWLYNRVMFGHLKQKHFFFFSDLTKRELFVFINLSFFILYVGVYPRCIFDYLHIIILYTLQK